MTYQLIISCPKCGVYRAKTTNNLVNVSFKCFSCGFTTTRKMKDRYGSNNFKLGNRYGYETIPEAVMRLNGAN